MSLSASTGAGDLSRVRVPGFIRWMAKWLALGMVLMAIFLFVAPWTQSAQGSGRLVAYTPEEREQLLEAPLKGRIVTWHVAEGVRVNKGDLIVDLADNDPDILNRLDQERRAVVQRMAASESQIEAYGRRIEALESSLGLAVQAAEAKIRMAENKVKAAQNTLKATRAANKAAKLNFTRTKELRQDGLASQRDKEVAEAKAAKAKSDFYKAKADLEASRADVLGAEASRDKARADAIASIEKTRSEIDKARADVAKAEEQLAKVDVKVSRQETMRVTAPRDGTIVRVIARQGGEFVKAGDPLVILVPDTDNQAVELWVDGNDASLVRPGRQVRLQFEGWPALQFVGWPSVAVGTFGGVVDFVDAAATAQGKVRIVVKPDADGWPEGPVLRQGVRAQGWVLLDDVSIGYELWRQLNGFPPVVADGAPWASQTQLKGDEGGKDGKGGSGGKSDKGK